MKIGLLGFGVVGRGVYDLVADREDIQVAKVLCLEDITLPDAEVTKDFNSILNDETIDTVVEAMGGLHPAYDFVQQYRIRRQPGQRNRSRYRHFQHQGCRYCCIH